MNYLISKEQYRVLSEKILRSFFGKISAGSLYDDSGEKRTVIELYTQSGINFADIWLKDSRFIKKGCKKMIILNIFEMEKLEKFAPIFRKKEFSKVMIDYVYKLTLLNLLIIYDKVTLGYSVYLSLFVVILLFNTFAIRLFIKLSFSVSLINFNFNNNNFLIIYPK